MAWSPSVRSVGLVVATSLAFAGACASDTKNRASSSAPAKTSAVVTTTTIAGTATTLPLLPTSPTPPAGSAALTFEIIEHDPPQNLQSSTDIPVTVGYADCDDRPVLGDIRFVAAYGTDAVIVAFYADPSARKPGAVCAGPGPSSGTTIHLTEPLGHRYLVDGAFSPPRVAFNPNSP
jgi:hypothetical protein